MKYLLSLICFVFLAGAITAQQPDTLSQQSDSAIVDLLLQTDTIPPKKKKEKKGFLKNLFDRSDYPNPKKAFILSAIVPGSGQIYNRKLWYIKVPVIYAGMGTMLSIIIFNTSQSRKLKTANLLRFDGDVDTIDEFANILDDQTLRNEWNVTRKNRDLSYVGMLILHILQSSEAFVQAHLLDFDVSDDLTLQLRPQVDMSPTTMGAAGGIGLSLQWKSPHPPALKPFLIP